MATVTFDWDASTGSPPAQGYEVFYGDASGSFTDSEDVGLNTQAIINIDLSVDKYAVVKAYIGGGTDKVFSTASNEVMIPAGTTAPPPNPPSNLTFVVS